MGWFEQKSSEHVAAQEYEEKKHSADLSHELLAGAAAYAAAEAYEKRSGKPTSHGEAKAVVAGLVGAFFDREVETVGMDKIDAEKRKHAEKAAIERAQQALAANNSF